MTAAYFDALRRALRDLPAAEVEDIVNEVASHVEERAELVGPDAALRAFGDPRDIASLYIADRMSRRPARPAPWRLLGAMRRIAGLGARGTAIAIASAAGYGFGLLLVAMALVKPFAPDVIGLWLIGGDDPGFSLGRSLAPQGEEVLGWWIIPIGLLLGGAAIYATWRASLAALRSVVRAALREIRSRE